ncbi:hypothetical protein BDM02DRAFT_3190509 [Thelephora ganbajun]|uniref:Uncharacterized protein n=1 Tax=Thelephora ganbajun TaxID=370292 RepID=A0ACB6Z4P2_THEGA|nr:hypothetical protein BDM02DRAFT_3190509 [Thelephora ganbajun]
MSLPYPPTDASQEDTDLIRPREYWYTPQAASPTPPPLQHYGNPGILGGVPEDQASNAHHPGTPLSYTPSSCQGLDDYQDTPEGGAEAYVSEGFPNPPWHLNLFQYASNDPRYSHEDVPHAYSNYPGTGDDRFDNQPASQYSSTVPAETPGFEYGVNEFSGPVPGWQCATTAVGFYPDDQHLDAKPNYNYVPYDGEERRFLGSKETGRSHPAATGSQPRFDHIQVTSGPADPLLPHLVGMVGNQGTSQVPAESSSVEVNNTRARSSKKGKQPATPYGRREGKRVRRKNPQRQERRQTAPVGTLFTRPGLLMVEQIMYESENTQKDWKPLPPIPFTVKGREGINLVDAMNEYFGDLDERDDLMFVDENTGTSVSCRPKFVGHEVCDKKPGQIPTKNYKKTRSPITKKKLAHDVAKLINVYLEDGEEQFHIPFENMFLTRLHNVARASWQPEVWYSTASASTST